MVTDTPNAQPPAEPDENPPAKPTDDEIIEDVTSAGTRAVQSGENPIAAMQDALAKFTLSDEDVQRISGRVMQDLRDAGAFDPPYERVAPPSQPTAPAAPGAVETPPPAAPEPRKTFAQRFMGQ